MIVERFGGTLFIEKYPYGSTILWIGSEVYFQGTSLRSDILFVVKLSTDRLTRFIAFHIVIHSNHPGVDRMFPMFNYHVPIGNGPI